MLETLLNVVWLLVACGIFAVYAKSQRKVRGGALALLCLVALLFPIISVTDDMATDATIIEEWSALRRPILAITALVLALVVLLFASLALVIEPRLAPTGERLEIAALTLLSASFATIWSFRPPPFALA